MKRPVSWSGISVGTCHQWLFDYQCSTVHVVWSCSAGELPSWNSGTGWGSSFLLHRVGRCKMDQNGLFLPIHIVLALALTRRPPRLQRRPRLSRLVEHRSSYLVFARHLRKPEGAFLELRLLRSSQIRSIRFFSFFHRFFHIFPLSMACYHGHCERVGWTEPRPRRACVSGTSWCRAKGLACCAFFFLIGCTKAQVDRVTGRGMSCFSPLYIVENLEEMWVHLLVWLAIDWGEVSWRTKNCWGS